MPAKNTKAAKTPKAVKAEEQEIEKDEETETASESSDSNDAVDVIKNGDIYIRQYSREIHGDDYEALAAEFVQKKNAAGKGVYKVVPSNEIGTLEVRYREKQDAELPLDKQNPDAPMADKTKVFDDKNDAVAFASSKLGATVVVSKRKK